MAEGKRRRGRGRVGLGVYKRARQLKRREGRAWGGGERGGETQQEDRKGRPRSSSDSSSSSPSSKGHRVTESRIHRREWHCPAGEVARHRNTWPCQSSASMGEQLGAPRGRQASGKWAGSRSCFHDPSRISPLLCKGVEGRGQLGIGNQRGPSGWHLRRRTVATAVRATRHVLCTCGTRLCPSHLLSFAGQCSAQALCFSLSLPLFLSHMPPCQRCGANTEIARAGLDEGPEMPMECSRPSAMT